MKTSDSHNITKREKFVKNRKLRIFAPTLISNQHRQAKFFSYSTVNLEVCSTHNHKPFFQTMKNLLIAVIVTVAIAAIGCGPSKEELEKKRKADSTRVADSLAAIKKAEEEKAAAEAAAKAKADSLAMADSLAKAAAGAKKK